MLPNWECDTDKAKGSAKLGFKTSAAAIIATAYWALGLGPLAFRIISWLRQTGREATQTGRERWELRLWG